MKSPLVIVFDLDDTLYPEREFVLSGFKAVDQAVENEMGTRGFYDLASELFQSGSRGNIFNQALQRLGLSDAPETIGKLISVYRQHYPQINLFPDAKSVLDQLGSRHKIALISDGYFQTQKNKAAALGLQTWMDKMIFTDGYGRDYWKPHPKSYSEIMSCYSARPGDCVYIADNPHKDFIGAKKLGWVTIRVRRPGGEHSATTLGPEHEAHIEIENLSQIAPEWLMEAQRLHSMREA